MGIATAAIIEHMIIDGKLGGRIYYVRGIRHGWAVYETRTQQKIVLDAAQQDKPLNLDDKRAIYYHGFGIQSYDAAKGMEDIKEQSPTFDPAKLEGVDPRNMTVDFSGGSTLEKVLEILRRKSKPDKPQS